VKMVSEKKKLAVKKLENELKKYPVIGMLDMYKLPSKQLQDIRDKLRGKAVIRMVRKNIMKFAMDNIKISGMNKLEDKIRDQPALLLSEVDPFELAKIIQSSRSSAPAKAGDVVDKDVVVKEGPTSLKPGPVIGELQRIKIPAGVEGDKIVVKKDTVVVKKGGEVTKPVADVLMKLGVEPVEISLNLLAVFDRGTIYTQELLLIPEGKYENDVLNAYRRAFNLSLNIGFLTPETIPFLITKAYREAVSLAREAGVMTKETMGNLLARAQTQAKALEDKVGGLKVEGVGGEKTPEEEGQKGGKEGGNKKEKSEKDNKSDADKKPKKEG
jgi:large subunit ribosomal protein L10